MTFFKRSPPPLRFASTPTQNPITRIEQVAVDLGRLAADIEDYAGPDAKRTLPHRRSELLTAVDDIQNLRAGDATPRADAGQASGNSYDILRLTH
ncbi:MAG TPA: hypothetical protein VK778_03755 [Solirubrobacteraceae bacterium]|jgi:hypothetical protein|nr:hypothetical protein [Solirubrobacteraceae bacterium]